MDQATLVIKAADNRASEPALTVTLQGSWTIGSKLPGPDLLAVQASNNPVTRVVFEAAESFSWDSRLLAWLMASQRQLGSCSFDLNALPGEVGELFRLANSVPASQAHTAVPATLQQKMFAGVARLGDEALGLLAFIGDLFLALGRWLLGKSSARWLDILSFCHQSGPSALAIITLQSVLIGMILAYLGVVQLRQFGAEVYVANLVGVGMVREMGALMTAVIMSGRTGAAYAAGLGTMQVNEEIDALTTLGIHPMDNLVLPRTLALLLTMPLLCLYSNVLGMLGGGLVATSMDVTWLLYLHQLRDAITVTDMATGVFKSFVFALLIAMAGCRAGLECGRSSAAVGQATTRAVVTALIYLIVADAGLNILFFHLGV